MSLIRAVFGKRDKPQAADGTGPAEATPDPAGKCVEVPGAVCFEITPNFKNLAAPLTNHVSYDSREYERLRLLRVEDFARANQYGNRPHDVFYDHPYPPVNPDHLLAEMTLKRSAPKAPHEFSTINGIRVVSERVKEAIAALEPGRHRFYPLLLTRHDRSASYRYFYMQFTEMLHCVCYEKSGFVEKRGQQGATYWTRPWANKQARTFLWEDGIGGRHLFRCQHARGDLVISAVLSARLGRFLPRSEDLVEAGIVRRR